MRLGRRPAVGQARERSVKFAFLGKDRVKTERETVNIVLSKAFLTLWRRTAGGRLRAKKIE